MSYKNYQPDYKQVIDFDNRISLIADHINDGKVLDIGCRSGWNVYRLMEWGKDVIGIDTDLDAQGPFFIRESVFSHLPNDYDYCLCLLLVHHYMNSKGIIDVNDEFYGFTEKAILLCNLIQVSCDISFFQLKIRNGLFEYPKLFFEKLGFDVEIIKSDKPYYGSPNPIFKCYS